MSSSTRRALRAAAIATAAGCAALSANAALVNVTVTVENLAPANSIAFAPLHVGFHNGTFDAFNLGAAATEPIISVAEGGAGGAWQAAFAAADPTATRGTVGGLLLPGATRSLTLQVDTTLNPHFTFSGMVVPSNDFFIGNDSPTEYRLFDAAGSLTLPFISVRADEIWDAGSELFDPAAAAFVGNNDLRTPQNGVVNFNFSELSGFNGLTTGAGYIFNSGLSAADEVYRIRFDVARVSEPGSLAVLAAGLFSMGFVARRRRGETLRTRGTGPAESIE
jgi:hypothetical protein